ncbi:alginate export family protein [Thermosulfuriphilus sp.]
MAGHLGKILILCLVFLGLIGLSLRASAYTLDSPSKVKIDFREEIRSETWATFDKGTGDDSYTFVSSKMRLGFGFESQLVDAYAQLHWTQFFGLPDEAVFGTGQLYYGQNPGEAQNLGYGALSQAWLRLRCPQLKGLSLRLGRFLYSSGLETIPQNSTLKWLKKARISQRLIGPFDWSRVGRAFDGFQLVYDQPLWNLTITAVQPTAGGFYLRRDDPEYNGKSVHDVDILALAATLKDSYLPGLDAQIFYYYYNDERGLFQDPEIHSIGSHLLYTREIGQGVADLLFWGVYQWGDYSSKDHRAYALAIEGGYKLKELPWQPWFRVGYFYGSGDDDPNDNDHETFFMMIPTLRIYALTPFYNLMNTNYIFGQVILKPHQKVVVRSDVHRIWLSEDQDYWYLGSGITRPDLFGYVPKNSGGDDDLATMWDISFFIKDLYRYGALNLGLNLYYGHVWGGDVVENNYSQGDDLDFFYVEAVFTF